MEGFLLKEKITIPTAAEDLFLNCKIIEFQVKHVFRYILSYILIRYILRFHVIILKFNLFPNYIEHLYPSL